MRVLACLLLTTLIAAAPLPVSPGCPNTALSPADRHKPVQVHPLNQEPGARQEIAVLRTDRNGCVHAVVVRENVGGKSPPVQSTPLTTQAVTPH